MAEKSSELRPADGLTDDDTTALTTDVRDNEGLEMKAVDVETEPPDTSELLTEEPEEIRAETTKTRQRMGETIYAIQEKLSISNISEQVKEQVSEQIGNAYESAKDSIYEATFAKVEDYIGKAGDFMRKMDNSEVIRTASGNPLPLTLIGLGIGLLAYNSFNKDSRRRVYRYDSEDREYRGHLSTPAMLRSGRKTGSDRYAGSERYTEGDSYTGDHQNTERDRNSESGIYDNVADTAGKAMESVTDTASSMYEGVTDTASSVYGSVTNTASGAYRKVGDLGSSAVETYDHYIEESPLAVGAVALAIGAVVGLSIPSTQYEGELLGEARQNLIEKAKSSAGGIVDSVKQVANETAKTVTDEVKAQTSSQ